VAIKSSRFLKYKATNLFYWILIKISTLRLGERSGEVCYLVKSGYFKEIWQIRYLKLLLHSFLHYNPVTMADSPKSPKQKPWSDIDLNRWREYEGVLTDSLWYFPSRASGEGHQLDYHSNSIPQIATQIFTRYSKKDEIVLDLFLGSGTTAIEAVRMERRCIGVELKPELVEYVRGKISSDLLDSRIHIIQGNSAAPETVEQISNILRTMQTEPSTSPRSLRPGSGRGERDDLLRPGFAHLWSG
jgi:hypothetical protein